jgi:cell division septation protein DedD
MAGKGTRHRFELSRLEIAGVIVSATAGLFVVFLLGIYAGRGMSDRKPDAGEQIVRQPVAPAVEQTPGAEDGLTFYDTLGQDERLARGETGEGHEARKPPREVAEAAPVAAPPEEPAAAKAADAGAHVEKPAKPEPPPPAAPVHEAVPPPKHEPEPVHQAAAPAPSPVAPPKAERAPVAPPSTARVAVALAPAVAPTPRAPVKGDWSVQVSATRDPRTADTVLRRLRSKGYDAFVLKVRRRGETFYRVRVGHYASLDEAQQVVSRLRREPGVPEAFVASD